eukprot:366146-Chlamydomonas_euryale.AAC.11
MLVPSSCSSCALCKPSRGGLAAAAPLHAPCSCRPRAHRAHHAPCLLQRAASVQQPHRLCQHGAGPPCWLAQLKPALPAPAAAGDWRGGGGGLNLCVDEVRICVSMRFESVCQ